METDGARDALSAQLSEIERGQAAPWVSTSPMAWWWALGFGVWVATYTLTLAFLDGVTQAMVQGLHVLVMLAGVWWMRRVRGTYPTGASPRELNGPFALLGVGAAVVTLAVWATFAGAGPWLAAAVGFVLAWALVAAYERAYAAASARVRERLG